MVCIVVLYTTVGQLRVEQMIETLNDMRKKYRLSVSPGNPKMGSIPSISLPPTQTCNYALACYNSSCYAKRMMAFRPNIFKAWSRNYKIYMDDPYAYKELLKDKLRFIKANGGNNYFRWHVGGDIPNAGYWNMMCDIANEMEDTKFMVFTKKYRIAQMFKKKPDNLSVLISLWPKEDQLIQNFIDSNWQTIRDIRGSKIAWLRDDPRIPSEGFNPYYCHGSCIHCKQCWTDKRDIVLSRH